MHASAMGPFPWVLILLAGVASSAGCLAAMDGHDCQASGDREPAEARFAFNGSLNGSARRAAFESHGWSLGGAAPGGEVSASLDAPSTGGLTGFSSVATDGGETRLQFFAGRPAPGGDAEAFLAPFVGPVVDDVEGALGPPLRSEYASLQPVVCQ